MMRVQRRLPHRNSVTQPRLGLKIALVTTPASARSGIGDYTRHLLPYLREEAEVDLFVDIGLEGEEDGWKNTRAVDQLQPRDYDQILYQLGNERQHAFMLPLIRALGGTVMLHDWVLFDLALAAHPELERGGLRGLRRAWSLGGFAEARRWAANHRAPREAGERDAPAGLGAGWHAPEEGGRWAAPVATLHTGGAQSVRIGIAACTGTSLRITQGGRELARSQGAEQFELELFGAGALRLEVRAARPTEEQRANGDARSLGAFVDSVEFKPAGDDWQALDLATARPAANAGISRDRFGLSFNQEVVRHADAFLVHSDWMGERVLTSRNQPTPIARVHHGAEQRWRDTDRRASRPESRRDAFVITSLGAMQAHKRVDVVLRALALARRSHPKLQLVCAGEARPAEFDHESLIRELALEGAVHITGYLPEQAAWDELHAADLCVNLRGPSAGGTSGGICQALSLGRAAITSDLPELAHLPESCVLRVPAGAGEVEALAAHFTSLSDDPARLSALEAAARSAVEDQLHWKHIAARYLEAMESFPHARASRRSLLVRFYHATKRDE
jgi:glycosyltransferase involved in cell wall biosynthesis